MYMYLVHLPAIFRLIFRFVKRKGFLKSMSSLSVFPPPPAEGEITLCEFNTRLIAESSKTAKLSKYVPATQVMHFNFQMSSCNVHRHLFNQFKYKTCSISSEIHHYLIPVITHLIALYPIRSLHIKLGGISCYNDRYITVHCTFIHGSIHLG